jgi:3-oxoadipate CoA-transferase alpha subunit
MINKVVKSFDEAVADIFDGAVLLVGGFAGPAECPSYLIAAVARKGTQRLTIVGNAGLMGSAQVRARRTAGALPVPDDFSTPALLIERGQVGKAVVAMAAAMTPAAKGPVEDAALRGVLQLETASQGTIVERVRAARSGIAAFYTPTGAGMKIAEGKEVREFDGRQCVLEHALKGDFSLVRAHKADRYGNLVYRGSSRTMNASMAGGSTVTIAEVDEVVELGDLDPECIVTPGVYVDRVVVRPPQPATWELPS